MAQFYDHVARNVSTTLEMANNYLVTVGAPLDLNRAMTAVLEHMRLMGIRDPRFEVVSTALVKVVDSEVLEHVRALSATCHAN
jgi:hypothetical protein